MIEKFHVIADENANLYFGNIYNVTECTSSFEW